MPAGQYKVIARADPYIGAADVVIDGEHPASVTLSLSAGVTVRGTATFDGQTPSRARLASVQLTPADSDSLLDDNNGVYGTLDAQGRFALNGVPPGRYVLHAMALERDGSSLASVMLGDTDITDTAMTVGREDIDGIVVSMTRAHTLLKGTVTTSDGSPANGVDVVAFPIDEKYRVRSSRRVQFDRTSVGGEYEIADLPPGTYGLAVVDEADQQALRDPAVVAKLRAIVTITLHAGETKTQPIAVK